VPTRNAAAGRLRHGELSAENCENTRHRIPTGFRHSAQGCRAGEATLGRSNRWAERRCPVGANPGRGAGKTRSNCRVPPGGGAQKPMVLTQSPVRKQVAPKNPHFPLVECPFCQENGVSTASNPGFAGKMPIRRRRIGIPAAKWRFDAVESAFSRQNGDSTGGGSPFFRQNADSTRGNWHFFDRMPIRRRRKRRFFGGRPVRRGRRGIPLAQGRSGTEGSDVPPGGSRFAAGAMASTTPDGLSAPGEAGSGRRKAVYHGKPPLVLPRKSAEGTKEPLKKSIIHEGTQINTNGIRVLRRPIRAGSCLFVV